jgi:hydrogenase nickel incorporation protein HypA/HybF
MIDREIENPNTKHETRNMKYETPNTKHQTLNTKNKFIMHEMGIALQIVEIATASIPSNLADVRIERVNLKVGKLAAVVPESLRFCFNVASKDTALDGAELIINELPVVARCNECNSEWTITSPVFKCETCNSGSLEILSGRELDIESIEIAEEVKNGSGK